MASLSPSTTTTTITATKTISLNPLSSKPSQLSAFWSSQTCRVTPLVSCNANTSKNDESNNVERNMFDRRNMLIGLGGLFGAATTLIGGPTAFAKPTGPDVTPTQPKTKPNTTKTLSHGSHGDKNGRGHGHGHGHDHGHEHGQGLFSKVKNAKAAELEAAPSLTFPKPLNGVIRTNVQRPVKSRSKKQKEDEEEVLIIDVELRRDVYTKFDVYVNDEDEVPTKENRTQTEYAGSFVNVPQKQSSRSTSGESMTTSVKFGLTELIEDLGADDDEGIDVTFVPRTGTESVVIKGVRIEFLK